MGKGQINTSYKSDREKMFSLFFYLYHPYFYVSMPLCLSMHFSMSCYLIYISEC